MTENFEKKKYERKIQMFVSQFIKNTLKDPRLQFLSLTKVELSNDFSHAILYWDSFGTGESIDQNEIAGVLNKSSGKLRKLLADSVKYRRVPELHFKYDSQYEDEMKIEILLQNDRNRTPSDELL